MFTRWVPGATGEKNVQALAGCYLMSRCKKRAAPEHLNVDSPKTIAEPGLSLPHTPVAPLHREVQRQPRVLPEF
jgi:hypothetical protein